MDNVNNSPDPETPIQAKAGWRRGTIVAIVAAVTVVGGAGVATVMANDGPGLGRHAMHAAWGGGGRFAERRFERMIEEIDATPEQADALRAIFEGARDDLSGMRDEMRGVREEVVAILSAETIDRAAAERLRAERTQSLDQASRRMTQALLDAAEVLTPAQRAELVERIGERRGHGRW
jgi:protein CpxP